MTRARDLARIANSNALTIDSSGNVGIGSTVPTSKLSVAGIVSATSFFGSGVNLTGISSVSFATTSFGLSGSPNITVTGVNASGVVTATSLVVSGVTTVSAGSASAPSISPSGDSNTGIFFPAADTLALVTAGTNRLHITSGGLVGIGTNSPTDTNGFGQCIDIRSSTGAAIYLRDSDDTTNDTFVIGRDNADSYLTSNSGNILFSNAGSERMRIDSSGRLLVGTSTPSATNELVSIKGTSPILILRASSGNPSLRFYDSNDTGADSCQFNYYDNTSLSIEVIPALPIKFLTTNTERMSIAAGGAVNVVGALSKGSGSFRIDHPLPEKKDTHQLVHSFIEGPQVDLIYRGHANLIEGKAVIDIDKTSNMTNGTFEALCRDICCFTSNETDWTPVRGHVDGNILTIEAQDITSTAEVCWMVIGERKDQHIMDTDWTDENGRVITEPLKQVAVS